jgi:hypothetical protein
MPAEFMPGKGVERSEKQWLLLRQDDPNCPHSVAFRTFIENTKGIVFRTAMPLTWNPEPVADWWPEQLDAVYINCDRRGEHLRSLVNSWKRHVRPGGNIYGLYRGHTVEGLTGMGHYAVDGTIWRYRIVKDYANAAV